MKRIVPLVLITLLMVNGITACNSSEPTPTVISEADSITIWYEGKGITLERDDSFSDKLCIESVKVIKEAGYAYGTLPGYENPSINSLKNRVKCLEITFKSGHRPEVGYGTQYEGVSPVEVSPVLFPFSKDYSNMVLMYAETPQLWLKRGSKRSTIGLEKMVDKYLEDSH